MVRIFRDPAAENIHKVETALSRARWGASFSTAAIAAARVARLVAPDTIFASKYLSIFGILGLIGSSALLQQSVLHIKFTQVRESHSTIVKTMKAIKSMAIPLALSALCTWSDTFPLFGVGAAAAFTIVSAIECYPHIRVIDFDFVPQDLD